MKDEAGKIIETPEQLFLRVASAIASADKLYGKSESEIDKLKSAFFRIMSSSEFLPNSPCLMNAGKELFFVNEKNELSLKFSPILPSWLFTKKEQNGFQKNTYAFKFLGKTLVVYHNPKMKDTVGKDSVKVSSSTLEYDDGRKIDIQKDIIGLPYSLDVRNRKIRRIDINLI